MFESLNFKKKRQERLRLEKEAKDALDARRLELERAIRDQKQREGATRRLRSRLLYQRERFDMDWWEYDGLTDVTQQADIEELEILLENATLAADAVEEDFRRLAGDQALFYHTETVKILEKLEVEKEDWKEMTTSLLESATSTLDGLGHNARLFRDWNTYAPKPLVLPEFELERRLAECTRQPGFLAEARRNLVESQLSSWLYEEPLGCVKQKVTRTLEDLDALVLCSSWFKEMVFEAFRVCERLPLYRFPAALLLGPIGESAQDVLLLEGVSDQEVETIAVLVGGESYPSLESALAAARVI